MLSPSVLRIFLLAALFECATAASSQQKPKPQPNEGPYPVDPDSDEQEGVPQGAVTSGALFADSAISPGTQRDYWVHVPAQCDESKPAALMVFQDGGGYRDTVATVFDNLIQKKQMAVTVAVFVNPGARAFDRAFAGR